ncbi:hypothetical protein [Streptomyces zaomyceticus]|uniref:hypothetical protein n=1 Tax=Streptomyces zaomyceticus TaxID=68286 RepID=UPI00167B1EC8|nr:hypothetical protein [Streptomyces zaomyceticus]GHG30343.1 hypothetical protein GCM10018791_53510 [Streptomyces zaomyceticus]
MPTIPFADVVNDSLPERGDRAAEVADGSALVAVIQEEPDEDAWFLNIAVWWWTAGLLVVATSVVVGFTGSVPPTRLSGSGQGRPRRRRR